MATPEPVGATGPRDPLREASRQMVERLMKDPQFLRQVAAQMNRSHQGETKHLTGDEFHQQYLPND